MRRDAWIWKELGIPGTDDAARIRRAYAVRLKAIDTEADPDAFIKLREARDHALAIAAGTPLEWTEPDEGAWAEDLWDPIALAEAVEKRPAGEEAPGGAVDDLPELEGAALERIDFLLFVSEEPVSPDELESLTRSILGDPATQNIEVARWVEVWLADRIARAMPLSDPMIEPAIAHFGWDGKDELSRPPLIDYILQRREDRLFEIDLDSSPGGYARLLDTLRNAPPAGMSRLAAWWRGTRMEYLIAYLQTFRPTVLRGLNPDTLQYWYDHFDAQGRTRGVPRWLRAWRRDQAWKTGLYGIDYSMRIVVACACLLMFVVFNWLDAFGTSPNRPGVPVPAPMPQAAPYSSPAADIAPVFEVALDYQVKLAELEASNPRLYERMAARWREARDKGEEPYVFRGAIGDMVDEAHSEALRGGSYELQSEHWRLFADEAKWARRYGNWSCDAYLRGGPPSGRLPQEFVARRQRLMAKALLEPGAKAVKRRPEGWTFSIPGPIFDAAVERSGLTPEKLSAALTSGGTPGEHCIGRIALVEAALEQPRKVAAPFLRDMSGGL